MMKKVVATLLLCFLWFASRETIITTQFAWQYNPWGSQTYNVIAYIPDNATGRLKTFIFFPGSGESGSNASALYTNGPLHYIQTGWRPNFIVIGIQTPWTYPGDKAWVQDALVKLHDPKYPIDWNNWYMTGLSYGAATLMGYMQSQPDSAYFKPTAVLPMSMGFNPSDYDLRFATVGFWGFCGESDAFFTGMSQYVAHLNSLGIPAKFTGIPGEAHCCWNTRYNPSWTEDGISIYDWATSFHNPLPIILVGFGAQVEDDHTVLTWSTQLESNNDHFLVQRSEDGITFSTVGAVPSKATNGNSNTVLDYSFSYAF